MKDLNWKTWVIIFAIAVGGIFEVLKRAPNSPLKAWDEDALRAGVQTQPYNVHPRHARALAPRAVPAKPVHAAGLAVSPEQLEQFVAQNQPKATEFGHDNKGAEGTDPKSKTAKKKKKKKLVLGDDEEWEYFTDPMTGKRYRRKKKKDLAKVEDTKDVAIDDDAKKEDSANNLINEVLTTGVVQAPAEPEATLGGFEEWVRRLLTYPDAAETRKFIDAYNTRLVTADVFYRIVRMMLDDSRAEMKELGLVCAGATPSLMSFNILASVAKSTPGSSTLRQQADKYLGQYTAIRYLSVLERVLRSPSIPFNAVLAAQKLEISANQFLSPAANKPPKDPAQQSTVHSNAAHYQRFVPVLEILANNSDATLKAQAAQTLSTIQGLLSNGGATPPVTPPTNTVADVQDQGALIPAQ